MLLEFTAVSNVKSEPMNLTDVVHGVRVEPQSTFGVFVRAIFCGRVQQDAVHILHDTDSGK
jgi:hypothetical protein